MFLAQIRCGAAAEYIIRHSVVLLIKDMSCHQAELDDLRVLQHTSFYHLSPSGA